MICKYKDECKYYDKTSKLCNDYGEYERSYCGVHRDKDEINQRFKFNKVAIK